MQIGSLVISSYTLDRAYYGVIVGESKAKSHWLVRWLTGKFTGYVEAFHECDLEVLCE